MNARYYARHWAIINSVLKEVKDRVGKQRQGKGPHSAQSVRCSVQVTAHLRSRHFLDSSLSGASLMSNQTFTGQTIPLSTLQPYRKLKAFQAATGLRVSQSPSPAHSFLLFGEFFPLFSATPHLALKVQ